MNLPVMSPPMMSTSHPKWRRALRNFSQHFVEAWMSEAKKIRTRISPLRRGLRVLTRVLAARSAGQALLRDALKQPRPGARGGPADGRRPAAGGGCSERADTALE